MSLPTWSSCGCRGCGVSLPSGKRGGVQHPWYDEHSRDMTIYVRECAVFNAWYNPNVGSISMCLELAQEAMKLVQRGLRPG